MISKSKMGVLAFATLFLGACQTGYFQPIARVTPMDGMWRSNDGVFVANFRGGSFTSRFTKTNEILAQGSYTVNGSNVSMQWISVQAQEQRTANCAFTGANTVNCTQAGGGSFGLSRST
jgi:hypothetical protein